MPSSASTAPVAQLDYLSLAGNFILVIVLLVGVLWLLQRLQSGKGIKGFRAADRRIAIVEALSVGPRQKLAIVRVDQRELLVGVSPNGFVLLDGASASSHAAPGDAP